MTSANAGLAVRLAVSAVAVSITAASAFVAGRDQVGYPALAGALLLVTGAGLTATQRDRAGVVHIAPIADVAAITAGHRGVSERGMQAIGA